MNHVVLLRLLGASTVRHMAIPHHTVKTRKPVLTVLNISLTLIITGVILDFVSTVKEPTQLIANCAQNTKKSCSTSPQKLGKTGEPTRLHFGKMKILQLNTRSLHTSKQLIQHYVERNKIKIAVLTETWNNEDKLTFKNWNTKNLFKNKQDSPRTSEKVKLQQDQTESTEIGGGAAILAAPDVKIVPRKDLDIFASLEIVWAQIQIGTDIVTIGCAYISPGRHDHFALLVENLKYVFKTVNTPVLLLGDLNARSYMWES